MRLEKLLASSKLASHDIVDGPEKPNITETKANVVELEEKVKSLTDALESSKNDSLDIDKIKGMKVFICSRFMMNLAISSLRHLQL